MGVTSGNEGSVDRESILELVSVITEFNDISEFMQDENLDLAMASIAKLIAKPDIPIQKVPLLVVQIQALSSKFNIQAKYYTAWGLGKAGTPGNRKKEVYFTMGAELEKLANALKYLAK